MDTTAAGAHPARRDRAVRGVIFPGRYLLITSYRRDGTPVATVVWFAQQGPLLLVQTDGGSGKVKRIRRNPAVTIAACSATGRLKGRLVTAQAWLLPASQTAEAERLLAHKYRADLVLLWPLRAVQRALHRAKAPGEAVILAIRPD